MTAQPSVALTDRFVRAIGYARIAHAAQVRKGTRIPYLTHLLGVATLVIEHGGSEDQPIAGLLHDLIEAAPISAIAGRCGASGIAWHQCMATERV